MKRVTLIRWSKIMHANHYQFCVFTWRKMYIYAFRICGMTLLIFWGTLVHLVDCSKHIMDLPFRLPPNNIFSKGTSVWKIHICPSIQVKAEQSRALLYYNNTLSGASCAVAFLKKQAYLMAFFCKNDPLYLRTSMELAPLSQIQVSGSSFQGRKGAESVRVLLVKGFGLSTFCFADSCMDIRHILQFKGCSNCLALY